MTGPAARFCEILSGLYSTIPASRPDRWVDASYAASQLETEQCWEMGGPRTAAVVREVVARGLWTYTPPSQSHGGRWRPREGAP